MAERTRIAGLEMPEVPDPDFVGALIEIWFGISYSAYHLAYVRVYLQTAALQTNKGVLDKQEEALRKLMQTDIVICRAHLAAFFWQLDHIFEALRGAINRGQKEHGDLKYFWRWEKALDEIEKSTLRKEISDYRNQGHQYPGIIGCKWDGDDKFIHHFLPTIDGHEPKEEIDIKGVLQRYFEFTVNVWLSFAPGDFKETFPRDFSFPVTVPNSFIGELPPELQSVPQLSVEIVAFNLHSSGDQAAESPVP